MQRESPPPLVAGAGLEDSDASPENTPSDSATGKVAQSLFMRRYNRARANNTKVPAPLVLGSSLAALGDGGRPARSPDRLSLPGELRPRSDSGSDSDGGVPKSASLPASPLSIKIPPRTVLSGPVHGSLSAAAAGRTKAAGGPGSGQPLRRSVDAIGLRHTPRRPSVPRLVVATPSSAQAVALGGMTAAPQRAQIPLSATLPVTHRQFGGFSDARPSETPSDSLSKSSAGDLSSGSMATASPPTSGSTPHHLMTTEDVPTDAYRHGPRQILPYLYLGSETNAVDLAMLRELGVGYILNVAQEVDYDWINELSASRRRVLEDFAAYSRNLGEAVPTDAEHSVRKAKAPAAPSKSPAPSDVRYLKISLNHNDSYLLQYFRRRPSKGAEVPLCPFDFIDEARARRTPVLVHCAQGVSRSASVVIGYVMETLRMDLPQAYQFVKARAPSICPNLYMMAELTQWESDLGASRASGDALGRPAASSGRFSSGRSGSVGPRGSASESSPILSPA